MNNTKAPSSTTQCVACRSTRNDVVFDEFGVHVLRCANCHHIFSSYLSGQDYDAYFDHEITDQERFWWDTAHKRMFSAFGKHFLAGRTGKLLDVGAGLGFFVLFAQQFKGWQAVGYEISPPAVEYAKNKLGIEKMYAGRVEDSGFALGSFNVITLWDVLEHIPDPTPFLDYLITLLTPDGVLFVATPNGPAQLLKARMKKRIIGMKEGAHYLEAKDHMNLYTPQSLRKILMRFGLQKVKFWHLPPIQSVSGSRNVLGIIAKNAWFRTAQVVGLLTRNRVNLNNNLYASALKR